MHGLQRGHLIRVPDMHLWIHTNPTPGLATWTAYTKISILVEEDLNHLGYSPAIGTTFEEVWDVVHRHLTESGSKDAKR